MLKSNLFARASLGAIAVAAIVSATPVSAQTVIAGGGASLPSSLLLDLFNCYNGVDNPAFPTNCAANAVRPSSEVAFQYDSVGSGNGLRGWASQDNRQFRNPPVVTEVDFGASDSPLTDSQYSIYNNGGRFSSSGVIAPVDLADVSDGCVSPASGIGNNDADPSAAINNAPCYDSPRAETGPPIQIPIAGTAVAIAFDPVYKNVRVSARGVQRLRFQYVTKPSGGGMNLSRDAFCGIFAGRIRVWDHPEITASNGGIPVWPDPADTNPGLGRQIEVVLRDDDSGTTNLFVRHLISVCGPTDAGFNGQPIGQRFPGSTAIPIAAGNFSSCPARANSVFPNGSYFQARGNEGVTTCLNTRNPGPNIGDERGNGRVGYLSPDFVQPYVSVDPYRGFGIVSADIANSTGRYIEPTPESIAPALANFPAPNGNDRADARNWVVGSVQSNPALNSVLNDPAGASSYPIVGTTNFLFYTCYENADETNALVSNNPNTFGFLNFLYATDGATGVGSNARVDVRNIIRGSGFETVPRDFRRAIIDTFTNNTSGLNLQIRTAPVPNGGTPFNAASPQPSIGCSVGG